MNNGFWFGSGNVFDPNAFMSEQQRIIDKITADAIAAAEAQKKAEEETKRQADKIWADIQAQQRAMFNGGNVWSFWK